VKVGFIGAGSMGSGMARNLIKAGHSVTVYNRTKSRAEALKEFGAQVAETPADAAKNAEALITMLADDTAVEGVILGPGDVIHSLPSGSVQISMSTISVDLSRRLLVAHNQAGQHYIAAPVFGRPDAAAAGKLFIVAGGESGQINRCKPLFDAMGQKTFEVGDVPASNVVKIAGNFLITTVIEGLAESFTLARKAGVDPRTFLDVMIGSLFDAPVYRNYGALIASAKFDPPGFKLKLGLKDNRLALALADEVTAPLPTANLIHDRFVTGMAQGLENSDWAAIAKISYQAAGL